MRKRAQLHLNLLVLCRPWPPQGPLLPIHLVLFGDVAAATAAVADAAAGSAAGAAVNDAGDAAAVAGSVTPPTTHTGWLERSKARVTGTRRTANVKRMKKGAKKQRHTQTKLTVVRKRSEQERRDEEGGGVNEGEDDSDSEAGDKKGKRPKKVVKLGGGGKTGVIT